MAERRQIRPREVTTPGGRTRDSYTTQVVANPTDIGALPGPSRGELEGLFDGLATFDKGLGKYMAEQQRKEAEAGRAARLMGENLGEGQGLDFTGGYMAMDMTVKGDQDGRDIADAYRTSFDPDADNFDDWLAKQYGERVNGMDPQFRAHYDKTVSEHVAKLRAEHGKAESERVTERLEANALYILDRHVGATVENGDELDEAAVGALRLSLKKMGVNGERFNALLFEAIKKYGDAGHPSVYDVLKKDRPDGTPGMYFIPEWKGKIDAAEQAAVTRYLTSRKAIDEKLQKERSEMQDREVGRVLLIEDEDEMREQFSQLIKRGVIQRASDIDKFQRIVESRVKREASPEQQETEAAMMIALTKGQIGPMDVMRATAERKITAAQRRTLLTQWDQMESDKRRDAATSGGVNALNRRFNSPLVRQGERVLDSLLDTFQKPDIEDRPELGQLSRSAKLAAELAYTQGIASGEIKPGQEIEAAKKIVEQYRPQDPEASPANTPEKAQRAAPPKAPEAPKVSKSSEMPPPEHFREQAKDTTAAGLERLMWSHGIPTAASEGTRHGLIGSLNRTAGRERGPR